MKKILLLISIFLLTGCYDNQELNELYIVTGIGISKDNNKYNVTYEILDSNKEGDSVSMDNLIVQGLGSTINEAFDNTNTLINKKPLFSHLKVVILHNSIEDKSLKEVLEYLIRKSDIRDEFNLVYTSINPKDIFNNTNDSIKVVSLEISELLNNGNNNINPTINESFEDTLSKILSNKQDIILNNITYKEDTIKLEGSYIFNNYNIINILNNKDTFLYLLLNNKGRNSTYNIKYKEGFLGISITDSKLDYNINNNIIEVKGKINALLTNNTSDLDLTKDKSLKIINNKFKVLLNSKLKEFIIKLQSNNSDILGLTNKYYKKTKIEDKDLWKHLDIKVDIDLTVNRKGLIFGVNNEK